MGFLRVIVAAFDKVDDAVTTARVHHGAQREAEKVARTFSEGDAIFIVNDYYLPDGKRELAEEYVVDRGGKVGGQGIAGLWLRNKLVSRTRPAGVMTMREYQEGMDAAQAPDVSGIGWPQQSRPKAGARR